MWRSLALAGTGVLLGVTAGCGGESADEAGEGSGTQEYCNAVRKAQREFGAIESGDLTGANVDRIFERMHRLADQAPPAVADEWRTLDRGIESMQSGLDDLGLSFGELSDPKALATVDPQKLRQFGERMRKVGGQRFQRAGNAVERHAKATCGVDLGGQGGGQGGGRGGGQGGGQGSR